MKKFLALLIVALMLVMTLASCDILELPTFNPPENSTTAATTEPEPPKHECEHACEECGKCLDAECAECTDKCEGHVPPHVCEHICEKCGKCLDAECNEDACADKCEGHHDVCESVCADCGKCLNAECAAEVCAAKCPGHYTLTVGGETIALDGGAVVGTLPEVPAVAGKTGKWMVDGVELTAETVYSWTEDKTAEAVYTAIVYNVVFKVDGAVLDTLTYTVDNATVEAPAVPAKTGYTGAWESFTLTTGDVEVNAVYTVIVYNVVFKADGETVATLTYTVENAAVEAPAVPAKEGYNGAWEAYKLTTGDVEVNAVYTIKTYTVTYTVNGNVVDTKTVNHGTVLEAPATIVDGAYYVTGWTANGAAYDFASAVKADLDLVADVALWDPSYNTQKGELSYYISNFDNASVMMGITETVWQNAWLNEQYTITEKGTVTQGSFSQVNGAVKGLNLVQHENNTWAGFSYKLPSALDLTKVETIAVRVAYPAWNAHYANFYMLVKSGETIVNPLNYAVQYNTYNADFNGVTPTLLTPDEKGDTCTLNVNFRECWVVIDAVALREATGLTSIEEINFAQKTSDINTYKLVLDEIYYTVGHDCESVCAECGKCLDPNCRAFSCAAKCEGHVPPHACEHVCEECGKCLDTECAEDACAAKCEGHVVSYDPSYLTQRDENSYYISNFDNASVMEGVTQDHVDPWGNRSAVAGNSVSQGSYTNGHGTFTGITFQQPSNAGTYGSFNYALPSAFDLSQAKTIVVRIAANTWSGGYFNSYIMLKSGNTYVNVNSYAKIYRGSSMNGVTPDALSGSVINGSVGNYLTAYIEIDVAALMEATGLTSIDGIVFGANSKTFTHAVDEIYYTVK